MSLDPAYGPSAAYFLDTLTRKLQMLAPGRRVELMIPAWQQHLIECAKGLGFSQRYEYHSMGLLLK